MSQQVSQHVNHVYEINGFPLMASLYPVINKGNVTNVIVRFRNVNDFKNTIIDRNNAIRLTEQAYREAKHLPAWDDALAGGSLSMAEVKRYANKLAQMGCHILITGETGTGKTALAQAITRTTDQQGNCITVDCNVDEDLAAKLLGSDSCPGTLQTADGTIFLD